MIEGLAGSLLGWLPMLAAMLVVWGGLIALVWLLFGSPPATPDEPLTADHILDQRYARGRHRRGRVADPPRRPRHDRLTPSAPDT